MLVALIMDKMRPGIVLLSLVVVFMAAGIITHPNRWWQDSATGA